MWHLMSTEQRAELRETWEQYQTLLSTLVVLGDGTPPPALSAASGEGTSTPDNAHNPKSTPWPLFNAAVAKPVTRKELHDTPAAMQALLEEAEQLQAWKHMGFEQRKRMVRCSSGSETRRQ